MNDGEVIKALGGYKIVAAQLGVSDENALHFERRAIPWKYRRAVKVLATRKKIKLPDDFLDKQRRA
jgi:hypothetical protein